MKCIFISLFTFALSLAGNAQMDFTLSEPLQHPLLNAMNDSVHAGSFQEITSILIARDGVLIYEAYYEGNAIESKHNVRSGTKTMATLLTGIAIKEGHISSEQNKIFDYLGHKLPVDNPDPRKDDITIEDLLTMSSCLECDDNNQASRGHEERMYIIEDWTQFYLNLPIRAYTFNPKPEDCPYGRSMSYCSSGAAAMADVIESAVDEKLDIFAKRHLFDPLEITDYTLHKTPLNILNTAGGSEYRSRDFLKMIQLFLNNGTWNGKEIMTASWVEKATSPKANAWEGMDYGYLLWLTDFGTDKKVSAYTMAGNGGNKILAIPELNVTIILTATNYNNRNAHNYTNTLLNEYIVPVLLDMQ